MWREGGGGDKTNVLINYYGTGPNEVRLAFVENQKESFFHHLVKNLKKIEEVPEGIRFTSKECEVP